MEWEAIAKLLATALGAIDQVIAKVKGNSEDARVKAAGDALTAIVAIVDAVKMGNLESLDPKTAQAELDRLLAALGQNDSAADSAIDEKFGADSDETL